MTLFELTHELLANGDGLCLEQFNALYDYIEKQEDSIERDSALSLMRDADATDNQFYIVPECNSITIPDNFIPTNGKEWES